MNEQFAKTFHDDRAEQWRAEADDSRLAAEATSSRASSARRDTPAVIALGRRLLASSAALIFGR